jgi:hypothetical protein
MNDVKLTRNKMKKNQIFGTLLGITRKFADYAEGSWLRGSRRIRLIAY